jgi:hypothetical protein
LLIVLEDCIIGFSICNSQPRVEVISVNVRIISIHVRVLFSLVKEKKRGVQKCVVEKGVHHNILNRKCS